MHFQSVSALAALASLANAQLKQVTDFKSSPTAVKMYSYVPANLQKPAPIIVAVHHCQGSATGYSSESGLMPQADKHGIILIFPNSKSSGGCFDVSSQATLKHDGGGDSQTIANMVQYAVDNYGGDSNRTYLVGTSSGAMMTNVLAGAYPNLFKAASVYSGVPDGCFAVSGATATQDPPGWSNACASGQLTHTGQQWGDMVRGYYPGYNGTRPRMQIFHGTADTTLQYPNYAEQLKQWSNVLGVSVKVDKTNTPQSGYTQSVYGVGSSSTAQLVGYSAQGVGHTVPQHPDLDIAFFGI